MDVCGGREALRLEVNIHYSTCHKCRFHDFPYESEVPISGYGIKRFESEHDVWEIIDLLIEECEGFKKQGRNVDTAKAVYKQLPHFACNNIIYDKQSQLDIKKYIYCKDFGISAHTGSFGDHPARWVDKTFILKSAFAKQEKDAIDGSRKNTNTV